MLKTTFARHENTLSFCLLAWSSLHYCSLDKTLWQVSNMAQIMEEWAAVVTQNTVNHDAPSVEMVQNAYISLRKHVTANGTMPEFEKPPCENGSLHSG